MKSTALSRQDRRTEKTFFQKHQGVIIVEIVLGILAIVLSPIEDSNGDSGTLSYVLGMLMLAVLMSGAIQNQEK
jgi:hypothetical protein